MKAPEEVTDQSRRSVQFLASAPDRRRQPLVSLDRAIELLNVVGVMLQRLCPVSDSDGRDIVNFYRFHGNHRMTSHGAEDERPDFFAHLLNRGDSLLDLAGAAPPGGCLLLKLNQAGVNRLELVDALGDDDHLLLGDRKSVV